jgi:integrase/recombinase XerD
MAGQVENRSGGEMATQIVEFPQAAVPRPRNKMVSLTPAEILAVLKAARARSARDWAMVLTAYRHGLRSSELCSLLLVNLNLKLGQLSTARLKGSLSTVQPICRHPGQPLLDEFRALKAWLAERRDDGSGFLFLSQKGGRLDRSAFYRVFQACAIAAGLPTEKCHPHALKHSLATHLISENVNLAWVKQCLGHKAIGSTMKYVAVSDNQATAGAQEALMRLF